MEGGWDLVGRDDELRDISRAVATGRGALLVGPAGVGRTRLARAASERADGPVQWFSGVSTASFSAAGTELLAAGPDLLVVVDDAHVLDDASLAFLHHLLEVTAVRFVLTACDDESLPPALAHLRKDGVLTPVPVRPLGLEAVDELVGAALPGQVDRDLRRWLVATCAGIPLLLRELLADALERDAVAFEGGRWHRRGPAAPPTARLREVVGARLGSLAADERAVVELLAVGGPLPVDVLEALTSTEAVLGVERRELLVAVPDRTEVEVALAHPVHAEVVLGELGLLQVRAHLRSLVDALGPAGHGRRDDRVRLALWRARLDDVPDWRSVLALAQEVAGAPHEDVALVATGGAGARRPSVHLVTALELARAAEAHGGGLEATTTVRTLCLRLGDLDGVATADARLDELATTPDERAQVARLRARDLAQSVAAADHAPASAAATLAVWGRPADALGAAAAVLDDVDASATDRVLAVAARAGALIQLGRTLEATTVTGAALGDVGGAAPGAVWALVTGHLYALLLGGRLEEAEATALACRRTAAGAGSDDGVAGIEVALASAALAQGRPATSVRWAQAALEKLTDAEMRDAALAVLAMSAAYRGDVATADAALDRVGVGTEALAIGPQLLRTRAWIEVAAGRIDEAIEDLLDSADACRGVTAYVGELGLLHDVARLGRPGAVADRVAEVVAEMDDALPPAVLAHVLALRDDDADGLEASAAAFGAIGAVGLAAEAWAQAVSAHRRAGSTPRAASAAARARAAAARCEGMATPAMAVELTPALTRRERQVAELAARGLPDRTVADDLGISVRTAETHLHNAFAKLGVRRRTELAAALAALP